MIKLAAAGTGSFVVALPIALILLFSPPPCGAGGDPGTSSPPPTAAAQKGIPANYLRIYRATGRKYKIPWSVLAGIGKVETNHGRLQAPGVKSGQNFAGAAGPMQIGIGGDATDNWSRPEVGIDANQDGKKSVYDPEDAIPGAARYLKASGAKSVHDMVLSYNPAEWYVGLVFSAARSYAGKTPDDLAAPPSDDAGADCEDGGGLPPGESGKFKIAPGANAPGRPLTREFTDFVEKMAGAYKGKLVLTTGTNHNRLSSSGNVSDHYSGNGGDFGMVLNGGTNDGPVGDRIATAAFMAAGLPTGEAAKRGREGGFQTAYADGLRIQIIWRAEGHHDHVHVGVGKRP